MLVASRDERIVEAYRIFKQCMQKHGKTIAFPKSTDPRKTYSWRYLDHFVGRVDALGLGDSSLTMLIQAVVLHAKDRDLLHRGIAILDHRDILNAARVKLEREVEGEKQVLRGIVRSYEFLQKQLSSERTPISVYTLLTKRATRLAYANITRWFKADDITAGFVAVSKTCRKALGTLPQHELLLFPKSTSLLKMRLLLTYNQSILPQLREILSNDLFEE